MRQIVNDDIFQKHHIFLRWIFCWQQNKSSVCRHWKFDDGILAFVLPFFSSHRNAYEKTFFSKVRHWLVLVEQNRNHITFHFLIKIFDNKFFLSLCKVFVIFYKNLFLCHFALNIFPSSVKIFLLINNQLVDLLKNLGRCIIKRLCEYFLLKVHRTFQTGNSYTEKFIQIVGKYS